MYSLLHVFKYVCGLVADHVLIKQDTRATTRSLITTFQSVLTNDFLLFYKTRRYKHFSAGNRELWYE